MLTKTSGGSLGSSMLGADEGLRMRPGLLSGQWLIRTSPKHGAWAGVFASLLELSRRGQEDLTVPQVP